MGEFWCNSGSPSNMKYEAGYRYNYTAITYLAGVDWDF